MTRRSLFSLPALFSVDPQPETQIQFRTFETPQPTAIPAASDFYTKHGILVDLWTPRPEVEAFSVRVRFDVANFPAPCEQTKVVARVRDIPTDCWTSVAFWTGQPAVVLDITVRDLTAARETVRKG